MQTMMNSTRLSSLNKITTKIIISYFCVGKKQIPFAIHHNNTHKMTRIHNERRVKQKKIEISKFKAFIVCIYI